jgi:hypothetical protein
VVAGDTPMHFFEALLQYLGLDNQIEIVTTQPRRGTRDTKGKRMEMSLMKPAKLTLVRPLSALFVRFVPFCGYA